MAQAFREKGFDEIDVGVNDYNIGGHTSWLPLPAKAEKVSLLAFRLNGVSDLPSVEKEIRAMLPFTMKIPNHRR